MSRPQEILADLEQRHPHAHTLAVRLALAVRIDPAYLRAIRLHFVPEADTDDELALWTSALVRSKGYDGFVFTHAVNDLLRAKLEKDKALWQKVWELTERLHRGEPPSLVAEERIRYAAMRVPYEGPGMLDEEIRKVLAWPGQGEADKLNRFGAYLLPTLPDAAAKSAEAWRLEDIVKDYPGFREGLKGKADARLFKDGLGLDINRLKKRPLFVRHAGTSLIFSTEPLDALAIEVPDTNPIELELRWDEPTYHNEEARYDGSFDYSGQRHRKERLVVQAGREGSEIQVGEGKVLVKTLAGDEFEFQTPFSRLVEDQISNLNAPLANEENASVALDISREAFFGVVDEIMKKRSINNENSILNPLEIFISYRWKGESIILADDLKFSLSAQPHSFKVMRDNSEVGYKADLERYMDQLRDRLYVIVLLSDGYLRSRHCMKELVTLWKHLDFRHRIFPIVLPDARIHKEVDRLRYKVFWEAKKAELQAAYDSLRDESHSLEVPAELNLYDDILEALLDIMHFISDMNTLSPEVLKAGNWQVLASAIQAEASNRKAEKDADSLVAEHVSVKPRLNQAFKFACDRTEQYTAFNGSLKDSKKKVHSFFLIGEEKQSHLGFVQRMKLELEGEFLQTKERALRCAVVDMLYPEPVNKDYDITCLLADMHYRFGLDPDAYMPTLQCRFGEMLKESPYTSPLTGNDYVLILININDFDFKCDHIAKCIEWFSKDFMSDLYDEVDDSLDAIDFPRIILVWGVIGTRKSDMLLAKSKVKELSQENPEFIILSELRGVRKIHLKRWFQRYLPSVSSQDVESWIQNFMKGRKLVPMIEVESFLEGLIIQYNAEKLRLDGGHRDISLLGLE